MCLVDLLVHSNMQGQRVKVKSVGEGRFGLHVELLQSAYVDAEHDRAGRQGPSSC